MRLRVTALVFFLSLCVSAVQLCLIISEINCDNPSLDTKEFVELYYLGGTSLSLDGYTLVFYNGNGNTAYRVTDLSGHYTDERGFFVIGSAELQPHPSIPLPPNSVQNGPDAIALYGPSWAPVAEGGNPSAVGLLDAIVYTSRRVPGNADELARVLTPGSVPYLEDDQALEGDESIERCWLSNNLYTFQTGHPTPGRDNNCTPPDPTHLWINKIVLAGTRPAGLVELGISVEMGPLTMVVYNTQMDTVSISTELQSNRLGISSVNLDTSAFSDLESWALAVYEGQVLDFPKGSPLSQLQPLDAFIYSGKKFPPSANLTETLIPGRIPFQLDSRVVEGDAYFIRCGVAHWTRDPGTFQFLQQRPGESSGCLWYNTCPYSTDGIITTEEPYEPPSRFGSDFLISEMNADSPGSAEDEEFIEIWHPSGRRTSLDDIWVLLFNGNDGKVYRELELHGYQTDNHGYFLIGSDKLKPNIALPANTIQNGPDAIAIYRSRSAPSTEGPDVPRRGLLDAVVYRARGSDRDSADLIKALTPGQLPLLEDPIALQTDESLSRCRLNKLDLNSFRVSSPTPRQMNECPFPPDELVINEVGGVSGEEVSQHNVFVELRGPARTSLQGFTVVLFGRGGVRHDILLDGTLGSDGLYLLGNRSGAEKNLPAVSSLGAVLLCFELPGAGTCGTNSQLHDLLEFSDDQSLRGVLREITAQQHIHPASSFDSVSRCAMKGSSVWTSSHSTPHLPNLCPSSAFSTPVDICLQQEADIFNCTEGGVAAFLEEYCQCGISGTHLKGMNLTCLSERLYVKGSVLALSDHQRELVAQKLQSTHTSSCSNNAQERLVKRGSPLGLQVGLVLAVVLLFALAGAIFYYLYKKKRPQDYYSMQLSEHESPVEL